MTTEYEKMMDEVAKVIEKYGYKNLGYQQSMEGVEVLRFVQDRTLVDIVTDYEISDKTYERIMRGDETAG